MIQFEITFVYTFIYIPITTLQVPITLIIFLLQIIVFLGTTNMFPNNPNKQI